MVNFCSLETRLATPISDHDKLKNFLSILNYAVSSILSGEMLDLKKSSNLIG